VNHSNVRRHVASCALNSKQAWNEQLALVELSYNNGYHASIGKAPEALYDRQYRTPLCWQAIDKALTIGPELIQATTEKIRVIQEQIRVTQSRQKSYANRRHRPLEFKVGYRVFLKVFKGITRYGRAVSLA